jgi:hypothetical protein
MRLLKDVGHGELKLIGNHDNDIPRLEHIFWLLITTLMHSAVLELL